MARRSVLPARRLQALKLDAPPQADQADALAVALCHAHSRTLAAVLAR